MGNLDQPLGLNASWGFSSRMIATSGEEFKAREAQLGERKSGSSADSVTMIRGVPIRATLSFNDIPSSIRSLAVLEVGHILRGADSKQTSVALWE